MSTVYFCAFVHMHSVLCVLVIIFVIAYMSIFVYICRRSELITVGGFNSLEFKHILKPLKFGILLPGNAL